MLRQFKNFRWISAALAALALVAFDALPTAPDARDTRLFRVDKGGKSLGPASHVRAALALQLVSVTPDQPQFWPDETARVRILMPGRGGQLLQVKWAKRDAVLRDVSGIKLDGDGVAVVVLQDGKADKLELGEYRVDVQTADGKAQGHTTFSVVEGTLGAVSLAYAFDRVTSPQALDAAKAGWYLGNAAGAGSRWGNGLSFKNELRVDNAPYDGEVQLIPRCMLSGCNGVEAGPQQKVRVEKGLLAATLNIGGHSGPFQVEIVTPNGSLRHQFDGSGHVEREMIAISKGVRWQHRVGLAPYEKTVQVPGRQLFVDHLPAPVDADPFEVESPVAKGGFVSFKARIDLKRAAALAWQPKPDGSFEAQPVEIPSELKAGAVVKLPVTAPMALLSVGGLAKSGDAEDFREGYVLALAPGGLTAKIAAPEKAAPNGTVEIGLEVRDAAGQPVQVAGIFEAYDIRVAARDPASQLASAVGDSVRTAGRHLDSWVDPIEIERQRRQEERQRKEEERREREEEKRQKRLEMQMRRAEKASMKGDAVGYGSVHLHASGAGMAMGGASVGYGGAAAKMEMKASAPRMAVAQGPVHAGHAHAAGEIDADESEPVREGEIKIAFVGVVHTDADGKATVQLPTPPQTGRLALRFTPVKGLDWTTAEAQTDLHRAASVELKAPRALVAGGSLDLQVVTQNKLDRPLVLVVSGAGFDRPVRMPVASGKQTHVIAWPAQAGELQAALVDEVGKVHDRRAVKIADVAKQKVTWSRLEVGGPKPVVAVAGETVIAYASPGALLRGTVANMVTTMESWFPHAEAVSAQLAVRTTLLAAIARGILPDDGYGKQLRAGFEQAALQLQRDLYDPQARMVRPFAGMAPSPLWSAWVASNLQIARRALKQVPQLRQSLPTAAVQAVDQLAKDLGDGMVARGEKPETFGFSAADDGAETVEIEVEGGGRFAVLTDDSVQQFVIDRLGPALDGCDDDCAQDSKRLGKALDQFRLARAFSRVGRLQWLTAQAKAAWAAGPKGQAAFDKLFGIVARGMILSQEPGMIQGPALLGGVYSQPMALPRFLELVLQMGLRQAESGTVLATIDGRQAKIAFGKPLSVTGRAELTLPRGAVARIDRAGSVDLRAATDKPFARATAAKAELAVGEQSLITVELDPSLDPLEYYALVAVPATVAIRQTEDALSDYKGQLIYGQQAMGAAKMQMIALPFRGLRTMRLWIEGLLPGAAPGLVAVRHVHDADKWCSVPIAQLKVTAAGKAEVAIRGTH